MKKKICKNCFSVKTADPCPRCGFTKTSVNRDPTILPRGTALSDRYRIGGCIGRGGFGITYLAYDIKNGKTVAIKEYFPPMLVHRERLYVIPNSEKNAEQFNLGAERFFTEADMVSRFNGNPNIVSIYECFYENNTAYFAMEYLDGITVENYVKRYGALTQHEVLYIAERLAMALVVLHSGQVLHRDISPDNVMLCADGRVKLIDFGSARQFTAGNSLGFTVLTKVGFTSLEQYTNKDAGKQTDIYSLGTLLYYTLTGRIPDAPYLRINDDDKFAERPDNVGQALWNIVCRAAAVRSCERFENAEQIKAALDNVDLKRCPVRLPDGYEPLRDVGASPIGVKAAPDKKRYIIPAAVCGAVCVCAAIAIPLELHRFPPENDIQTTGGPSSVSEYHTIPTAVTSVELSLDNEYKGHFNSSGHIPSSYLRDFEGDVSVTIRFEAWENTPSNDILGLIPVNSDGESMLEYLTSLPGSWADENGYIDVTYVGGSYSFVISREGIESLGGGDLCFEAYNVIVTSASLAPSEPQSAYYIRSYDDRNLPTYTDGDAICIGFDEYTATEWGGLQTGSIPKSAFYDIDGDVKVTIEFEHLPQAFDAWQVIYVRNSGWCYNVFDDDFLVPQLTDNHGRALINRDSSYAIVPDISCTECVFIIPEHLKAKMSSGIFFQSVSAAVKSARLEKYSGEYDEFAKWEG